MVDLRPFKIQIDKARSEINIYSDPREEFKNELISNGFAAPNLLPLGTLFRMTGPDDKKGKQSGWGIYNEFADSQHEARAFGVGTYGSWKGHPDKVTWTSKLAGSMSASDQAHYAQQIEAARAMRDAELKALQEAAAQRAYEVWASAPNASPDSPYLKRKGIPAADGIRQLADRICIPITIDGQITSLQLIKDHGVFDHGTNKKFLPDGRKKGCYFEIRGSGDQIYICEGYATAASVHAATGATCFVAFDSGNLYEVAAHLKAKMPHAIIIIAGDDDRESDSNTGRLKAEQAADGLGLQAIFPSGVKDWNDMHTAQGIDAVKKLLLFSPPPYENKPVAISAASTDAAPGILGALADYYNATAGNKQPLFAIQTAIAICSVVCARNFETNLSNRSSLFMINIAKSGTGKEHAKKTMEKVLNACGMGRLVSNDGYTSGAGVISALQDRPRHITVIDEFSKYLQAANNKYGSSHLAEANTQLMQAISRLEGVMRPRNYATLGLTREKRKEMSEIKIINPAITLLAMSTPDELFENLTLTAIKDGFMNRFLICISSAERTIREHKESIDVPQNIIDWVAHIENRRGINSENAADDPKICSLYFTQEAMTVQRQFQQFCIETANSLERFGMADIVGRANEIAMRLSLIAALAHDPYAKEINAPHMAWAVEWVKYNLLVLVEKLKMTVSSSLHEGDKKEILAAIRAAREGVLWTTMQKNQPFSKHKQRDLKEVLTSLVDAELIIHEPHPGSGKGRPTLVYRAIA